MFVDEIVKVIGVHECPLHYKIGDEFVLLDKALLPPPGKPACLILSGDILEVLLRYEDRGDHQKYRFYCSECAGLIKLEYKKENIPPAVESDGYDIEAIVSLLSKFPFFQPLTEHVIKDLVSFLKLKKFDKGDTIIKKADPGRNLFIVVSGKVEVVGDGGMHLDFLGSGEIFGEMSLISGRPVGATIKVVEPARVLYLNGEDFRKTINKYPSLQMYLASLLAQRLAKANLARAAELASGMIGKLSEIPPSGIFQTLNLNQKTGVLFLELVKGPADVSFREGEVISSKYNQKEGKEAFFEILKEREGRFKFITGLSPEEMKAPKLGDFMGLLMEGIKRIDEANKENMRMI
ncbi:MAG: cyclic nucleotide-binding domain-containing protein [Desulfobacterales bacterium]|nr:cyclic nucleotide-binding domain-containing protein [Desulfobacterales bacterium]